MKDMLRISVLCIGFFLLLGRVDGQVLSPKQAYQLTIHQNVQEGATHNGKKPKPVDFLFWDKVKQGEDLHFTIAIKAKKRDLDSLIIVADDFVTDGHMGSLSKGFFRYSEHPIDGANWEPLKPISIKKGETITLYCLIKIPKYISPTLYKGVLHIRTSQIATRDIPVAIGVSMEYKKGF